MLTDKFAKLKWWQIALVSIAVSAIGGLASMQSHKKNIGEYEDKLKQAPWAPPGWLFAPAWTMNNLFVIMALQRLVPANTADRKKLLALQVAIWSVFFSFGRVYFKNKSSVLAAIWTVGDTGFAAGSFAIAL